MASAVSLMKSVVGIEVKGFAGAGVVVATDGDAIGAREDLSGEGEAGVWQSPSEKSN